MEVHSSSSGTDASEDLSGFQLGNMSDGTNSESLVRPGPSHHCSGESGAGIEAGVSPDCSASDSLQRDLSGAQRFTDIHSSTPVAPRGRPRFRLSPVRRGLRLTVRDWSCGPGDARRRKSKRRNLNKKINYSDEGEVWISPEKNRRATGFRWRAKSPKSLKYVDDNTIVTKINMQTGREVGRDEGGKMIKEKHDLLTQNLFRRVVGRAEGRGMVVNNAKTKIICMSDANTYRPRAFFIDDDGNRLESGGTIKVLGFHLDGHPSVHAHVEALGQRMRVSVWVLRHLGLSGFNQSELATVYRTVLRPILDFCCVFYQSILTDEQDQIIERIQSQALKNIYDYKMSYADMREKAEVTTLRARRIEMCDKFAEKAAHSGRFSCWFPLTEGRQSARNGGEKYREFTARTDRLNSSPLFYYRRRFNGKAGKTYRDT